MDRMALRLLVRPFDPVDNDVVAGEVPPAAAGPLASDVLPAQPHLVGGRLRRPWLRSGWPGSSMWPPSSVRLSSMTTSRPAFVEGEEVDAAAGVLPGAELVGDDEQILVEGGDVVSEQALQVGSLVEAQGGEAAGGRRSRPSSVTSKSGIGPPAQRQAPGMTLPPRPGASGETPHQRLEERRRLVERALSAARQHPVSRPLTAELVPSRMWRLNLRTILRPAEWTALSDAVAAAADRRCEICGGVGPRHPVEAHEVWAWAGHTQRLTRLVALCPRCHVVKHAGRARKLGWEDDVVDQLRKVNGWTKPQVSGHLKDAWDDWAPPQRLGVGAGPVRTGHRAHGRAPRLG